MYRTLLLVCGAVAVIAVPVDAAQSVRVGSPVAVLESGWIGALAPPRSMFERFAASDIVVTGKVTGFEKDTVEAPSPYPGAKDKQTYKIAVVKIDTGFAGAEKLKEIRVGFLMPPKENPTGRPFR